MTIYHARFFASDGIYSIDVIEHEGEFWLVPEWLDNLEAGTSSPARIVRLDSVPHRKNLAGRDHQFDVLYGVPKAAVFGFALSPGQQRSDLVEAPDIQVVRPIH